MKKHNYILLIFAGFILVSCKKTLDIQPLDMIASSAVFTDKALTEANLISLYRDTRLQRTGGQENFNMGLIAAVGAEVRPFGDWQDPYAASIKNYDATGASYLGYWAYGGIRRINEFIEGVQGSAFDAAFKNQKLGEARFLRAFVYFQMVKRYGGIPLITRVLKETDPEEVLFPARNSEQEIYDFIGHEMDTVAQMLPETYSSNDNGRASKYAALALKSRAMLYAGSIATFGTVDLNGLLGIPAGQAGHYYQESLNASKAIMDAGQFSLYNKFPTDPVKNFTQLFIDEDNNPESIFAERWDAKLLKGHSWDALCTPAGFSSSWNSNFNVFLDFVDLFDYQDGSSGVLNRSKMNANTYWDADSTFGMKDPRFRASVFYPETIWQGKKVLFHSKTYYTDPNTNTRKSSTSETFIVPNSVSADNPNGWQGKAPNRNTVKTGFHLRKRVDESLIPATGGQSNTDFMVFRYGEILLNYAEAAFYLNMPTEALDAINQIRERAQMPDRLSLTEDNIRQERQVELAFEEHRYWDLRRWRIAEQVLNGVRLKGVTFEYDFDKKKYTMVVKNAEGTTRVFLARHYYLPLGINNLADNPNLVENPGY